MTDQQESNSRKGRVPVRLVWSDTPDATTVYANQLIITHAGGEFYLIFGEVSLPVSQLADITSDAAPEKLAVKQVAKVVVTPEVMERFAKVIQTNFRNYLRHSEQEENEE